VNLSSCCVLCSEELFVICVSLSDVGKKWLQALGSNLVNKLQFRDSFVLLGQRGLSLPGTAIEQVSDDFSCS